jgi:hypothetical protein
MVFISLCSDSVFVLWTLMWLYRSVRSHISRTRHVFVHRDSVIIVFMIWLIHWIQFLLTLMSDAQLPRSFISHRCMQWDTQANALDPQIFSCVNLSGDKVTGGSHHLIFNVITINHVITFKCIIHQVTKFTGVFILFHQVTKFTRSCISLHQVTSSPAHVYFTRWQSSPEYLMNSYPWKLGVERASLQHMRWFVMIVT